MPRYPTPEDTDWSAWLRRLGTSMRDLRESLGLSQEEVASRAGLSQGSVSRFENGRNTHIGALVVLKLGAALVRQCDGPREPLLREAMTGVLDDFVRLSGGPCGDRDVPATNGTATNGCVDSRNLFSREGETWTVTHEGSIRPLRDNKGMRYIAHLLRNAGHDVHVLDLVSDGAVHRDACNHDGGCAAPTPHRITERARLSVTRAIRRAVFRIASVQPALGRHLHAAIRTGTHCAYWPDAQQPIAWEVAETD